MNKRNYTIKNATKEQINYISDTYWQRAEKWQQNRYHYHNYVATDNAGTLLGYLTLDEKDIPIPPYGKDWFIVTAVVFKVYRRCGVGTALLDYALAEAKNAGILHFYGSANATKEAHGFWTSNGFACIKYGSPKTDPSKPRELGNHHHFIFRRVDHAALSTSFDHPTDVPITTVKADKMQRDDLFDKTMKQAVFPYVFDKKEASRAILAKNEHGDTVGYVTFYDEAMISPLSGTNRIIAFLYIKDEFRKMGLARKLLCEFIKNAQLDGIDQIIGIYPDEAAVPILVHLGFDIFFTRHMMSFPNGKYSVGIGKRLGKGSLVAIS